MRESLFKIVFIVFVCLAGITHDTFAQGVGQNKSKFIRKLQKTTWTAGLSGTVIDDDAKAFKDIFNVTEAWNFLYYPSKINFEGYRDFGLSIEGSFTYSVLRKGKLLGTSYRRPNDVTLIAFDVNAKFDPLEMIGNTKKYTPYVLAGLGITYRSLTEKQVGIMFNFGFGLSLWIYRGFGLNVQTVAKFGINNPSSKNYLQHSVGLVYRFNLLTGYKVANRTMRRYNLFNNN